MRTAHSIVSEIMAQERSWRVPSAAAPVSCIVPPPPVPQKVRAAVALRPNGIPYTAAPYDGRRARWQHGSRRIVVTPRQLRAMTERLASVEFFPPGLSAADKRFLADRTAALLERLFASPDAGSDIPRRVAVTPEQYRALRRTWEPVRWLKASLNGKELSLARERVRDWLARTFVVVEEVPPPGANGGKR